MTSHLPNPHTLAVKNLRVHLHDQPVLRDLSLYIPAGQSHALIGESGAGKSMLVRTILGVQPKDARILHGKILLLGQNLLTLPPPQRRRLLAQNLALVPQNPMSALNPSKRAAKPLIDALKKLPPNQNASLRSSLINSLSQVLIQNPQRVASLYPHQLSGGQRQRILIAAAAAKQPSLILADEPTTALDPVAQNTVLSLLRSLLSKTRASLLFVTHNLPLAAQLQCHVSVLHAGRVLESAPAKQFFSAPKHPYSQALLRAANPSHTQPPQPVPDALLLSLLAQAEATDPTP